MKVLTAAPASRPGDLCAAIPGEITHLTIACGCGTPYCSRTAFTGLSSRYGCTRAVVAEVNVTMAELVDMCRDSLRRDGWDATADDAEGCATELCGLAEAYEVGVYLRRTVDDDGEDDVVPEDEPE